MYNLSVEGEQEFFANGILVHNCAAAYDYLKMSEEVAPTPESVFGSAGWYAEEEERMMESALASVRQRLSDEFEDDMDDGRELA